MTEEAGDGFVNYLIEHDPEEKFGSQGLAILRGEFCTEVALLKHRAGELGLFKTMHALEEGVTAVGWEVAEKLEARNE